jgi:hypothetical protein
MQALGRRLCGALQQEFADTVILLVPARRLGERDGKSHDEGRASNNGSTQIMDTRQ